MITRKSASWKAHILATADDFCTLNIVGVKLGVTPHTTGMPTILPEAGNDYKIHTTQVLYYQSSLQDSCAFYYSKNSRFQNDNHAELSIIAKRHIKKGKVVEGLSGATYPIEPQYIVEGINDFSLIVSDRSKFDLLFLGPAAFCNHDCKANAEIVSYSKIRTNIKAITDINEGDEISVYYGRHYFDQDNVQCLCQSCANDRLADSSTFNIVETSVMSAVSVVDEPPPSNKSHSEGRREVFVALVHSLTTPTTISACHGSDGEHSQTNDEWKLPIRETHANTIKHPPVILVSKEREKNIGNHCSCYTIINISLRRP